MSKLLKLKDWVTLEDAARHLTAALGEEVKRSDLLHFAVAGQLTISVNIDRAGIAKKGTIVPRSAVPVVKGLPRLAKDGPSDDVEVLLGIPLDDGTYIVFESEENIRVEGVWDLPMIGDDRLAVKRLLNQSLKAPIDVDTMTLDGAFISYPGHSDDEVWQLQATGTRRKTNPEWLRQKLAGEPLEDVKQVVEGEETFYYPAPALPMGSFLVIRSEELQRFIQEATSDSQVEATKDGEMKARERNAWQAIVGALVDLLVKPSGPYPDSPTVVAKLVSKYGDDPPPGLSKSNLRKIKESVDYLKGVLGK